MMKLIALLCLLARASGISIETMRWEDLRPPCALVVKVAASNQEKVTGEIVEAICDKGKSHAQEKTMTFELAHVQRAEPMENAWVASFEYWDDSGTEGFQKNETALLIDVKGVSGFRGGRYFPVKGSPQRIEKARLMMDPGRLKTFLNTATPDTLAKHLGDRDIEKQVIKSLKKRGSFTPKFAVSLAAGTDPTVLSTFISHLTEDGKTERGRKFVGEAAALAISQHNRGALTGLLNVTHAREELLPKDGKVLLGVMKELGPEFSSLDLNVRLALLTNPYLVKSLKSSEREIADAKGHFLEVGGQEHASSALNSYYELLAKSERAVFLRDLLPKSCKTDDDPGNELMDFIKDRVKDSPDRNLFEPIAALTPRNADQAESRLRALFSLATHHKDFREKLGVVTKAAVKRYPSILENIGVWEERAEFLKEGVYQEDRRSIPITLTNGRSTPLAKTGIFLKWDKEVGYVEAFLGDTSTNKSFYLPQPERHSWLGLIEFRADKINPERITAYVPNSYSAESDQDLREDLDADGGKSFLLRMRSGEKSNIPETHCEAIVEETKNQRARITIKAKSKRLTEWYSQKGFTPEVLAEPGVRKAPHPWKACYITNVLGVGDGIVAFNVRVTTWGEDS